MAKIQEKKLKKQITSKKFYIDSALFIVDADLFKSITLPHNIIQVDADTGETIREFKAKAIRIDYHKFTIFVSSYIKKNPNGEYPKFKFSLKAKACKHYLSGILKIDIQDVLRYLRLIGYLDYNDNQEDKIIANIHTLDTDITYNVITNTNKIPYQIEVWKQIAKTSETIKVGNAKDNQMLQFSKRGDKYFFKIYNKNLEIRKKLEEYYNLNLKSNERQLFESLDNTMLRLEFTIRNIDDYKSFNLSNKLVDLWSIFENEPQKITELIKLYYDKNTGNYKPKPRIYGKLSPTDNIILALLSALKKAKYNPFEMLNIALSLFESNNNKERMTKSRAKNKIQYLIDYLYTNSEELQEIADKNNQAYNFIMKNMFFKDM